MYGWSRVFACSGVLALAGSAWAGDVVLEAELDCWGPEPSLPTDNGRTEAQWETSAGPVHYRAKWDWAEAYFLPDPETEDENCPQRQAPTLVLVGARVDYRFDASEAAGSIDGKFGGSTTVCVTFSDDGSAWSAHEYGTVTWGTGSFKGATGTIEQTFDSLLFTAPSIDACDPGVLAAGGGATFVVELSVPD